MAQPTAEQLAKRVCDLKLVSRNEINALRTQFDFGRSTPEQFTNLLLHRKLLTPYQVDRLLRGEKTGYYIGKYKILRVVSHGTFARVFEATKGDENTVALKVLRKSQSGDPNVRERFRREGELCLTLNHPNIVRVYDVQCGGPLYYLVMELVEGYSLRDVIRQHGKVRPLMATQMMQQMASALYYAATRGLLHRDLKETNVLLDRSGQIKLIDFGLAGIDSDFARGEVKVSDENTRTVDYSALEKLSRVKYGDHRSDIFFAGCIYYHMLTGQPPLSDTRDPEERADPSRFTGIKPIHDVDRNLPGCVTAIATKAMQIAPALRYQSFGEMLVDLRRAGQVLEKQPRGESPSSSGSSGSHSSIQPGAPIFLFVEKDEKLQSVFRELARHNKFRALIFTDAERALERMTSDIEEGITAVIFDGAGGKDVFDGYRKFNNMAALQGIPSLLMVPKQEKHQAASIQEAAHRKIAITPCKIEVLLGLLNEALQGAAAQAKAT